MKEDGLRKSKVRNKTVLIEIVLPLPFAGKTGIPVFVQ